MRAKRHTDANVWVLLLVAHSMAPSAARAGEPARGTPADHANARKLFVEANNSFALELYHQLSLGPKDENLFISPYSISQVLLMVAEGARGETAIQMGKALRFPNSLRNGSDTDPTSWNLAPLHEGAKELNTSLQTPVSGESKDIRDEIDQLQAELRQLNKQVDQLTRENKWPRPYIRQEAVVNRLNALLVLVDRYEVQVANALWCEKTCPLRTEFVETIDQHYETGGVLAVDFKFNPEESRRLINEWVAEKTSRRITDFIAPGALNELTRLVLANAIYFKGQWSEPFEEKRTKESDFYRADGGTSKVLMMEAHLLAGYAAFEADGTFFDTPDTIPEAQDGASRVATYPRDGGFAMLELPYKGNQISMVLIAPNRPSGLPEVERTLASEGLQRWIEQLNQRRTHVMVPRFRLEGDYSMAEVLGRLGMVRAFKDARFPGGAQFGGMTRSTDPNELFQISAVLHKALVEVNEKGTEAVAATIAMGAIGSEMIRSIPFVPTFQADRPFLFMILDRPTGAILFIGRMQKPDKV